MTITKKSIISLLIALTVCFVMMPQGADAAVKGNKGFSGKTVTSKSADKIIKVAKSKLGCPYVSGAAGPNAFDCSGFVAYCMHKAGVKLTRSSAAAYYKPKYNVGSNIKKAQKGDIVLYTAGGGIGHCALYIGKGNVIHATCSGGIRITSYNGIGQSVVAIIRTYSKAGAAKIKVSDKNETVKGTKYKVIGKSFKKTVKVNAKGEVKVRNLKAGAYKVKPVSVSKEYQEKLTKEFVVKNGEVTKVKFKNIFTKVQNWIEEKTEKQEAAKAANEAKEENAKADDTAKADDKDQAASKEQQAQTSKDQELENAVDEAVANTK